MNEKSKILIVDDESINILILNELLSKDYIVISSINSNLVIDMVNQKNPDLILLDIKMPGISGLDLCKELKENENTKDIPILFITSVDDENIIEEAFNSGGVDYILKPINPEILFSKIKKHLSVKKMEKELNTMKNELK